MDPLGEWGWQATFRDSTEAPTAAWGSRMTARDGKALLYALASNDAVDRVDVLGLDPRGPGGVHPALANPQFHLAKMVQNLAQITNHLSRPQPGFGCAHRLAMDALNHAVMYREHTGDDGPRQEWQRQVDAIRDWENAYWAAERTRRFCRPIVLVSGAVLAVCLPECVPFLRAVPLFRFCPAAP